MRVCWWWTTKITCAHAPGEHWESLGYESRWPAAGTRRWPVRAGACQVSPLRCRRPGPDDSGGHGWRRHAGAPWRGVDPDVRAVASSGCSVDPVMADPAAHGFQAALIKPYTISSWPPPSPRCWASRAAEVRWHQCPPCGVRKLRWREMGRLAAVLREACAAIVSGSTDPGPFSPRVEIEPTEEGVVMRLSQTPKPSASSAAWLPFCGCLIRSWPARRPPSAER